MEAFATPLPIHTHTHTTSSRCRPMVKRVGQMFKGYLLGTCQYFRLVVCLPDWHPSRRHHVRGIKRKSILLLELRMAWTGRLLFLRIFQFKEILAGHLPTEILVIIQFRYPIWEPHYIGNTGAKMIQLRVEKATTILGYENIREKTFFKRENRTIFLRPSRDVNFQRTVKTVNLYLGRVVRKAVNARIKNKPEVWKKMSPINFIIFWTHFWHLNLCMYFIKAFSALLYRQAGDIVEHWESTQLFILR